MKSIRSVLSIVIVAQSLSIPLGALTQVPTVLRGQVADAESQRAVAGAFVVQLGTERGVLTDSLGRFSITLIPELQHAIRVSQLGYRDLQARIPPWGRGGMLNVRLVPDPIVLEGLQVLAERLADRRRGPFGVADLLFQDELLRGPDGSAYELVRRILPFAWPCNPEQTEALCMGGHTEAGRPRRVTVCVDDHAVTPDLAETILSSLDPRALYLVEGYRRVGQVRMYTRGYVQRLAAEGTGLPPLAMGCTGPPS